MNLELIKQVVQLIRAAKITELTVRNGEERLTVRQSRLPGAASPPPPDHPPELPVEPVAPTALPETPIPEEPPPPAPAAWIKAHLVGIFHPGPGPQANPLKQVGDWVEEGDLVGMIESMRHLVEVHSPVRGRIKAVLVGPEQTVEYGQDLFEVDETAGP